LSSAIPQSSATSQSSKQQNLKDLTEMKNTLDDEPFKVSIAEEVKKIFSKALGFKKIFLGSVNIGYSKSGGIQIQNTVKDEVGRNQLPRAQMQNQGHPQKKAK
jgi:hypothetical protein